MRQGALQVGEARRAQQEFADDENRPALAEDFGGLGDRTELTVADAHRWYLILQKK